MSAEPRDRAEVRIIPPIAPVVTILLGLAAQRVVPIDFALPTPARYWIGGGVIVVAGIGLGLWPVILFRRSGQSPKPWKPTPTIVDQGPFRISRNPMYLQMIVTCLGLGVVLSNLWVIALTPLCALALQRLAIVPEEAYLERKFGEEYLSYKRRVRRWL